MRQASRRPISERPRPKGGFDVNLLPGSHKGAVELERIREQRLQRIAARDRLSRSFRTPEEATTNFMNVVGQKREFAQTHFEHLARHGVTVEMQELLPNTLGVLALLLPDIEARALKVFRPLCGDDGITSSDLASRTAELTEQIESLEVAEEKSVMALEDQGFAVPRRADINPELILELWSAT